MEDKLIYTTEELSKEFHIERHRFKAYRENGLLVGTKVGHGWIYFKDDVMDFLRFIRGKDISSDYKIALAGQIKSASEKAPKKGGNRSNKR